MRVLRVLWRFKRGAMPSERSLRAVRGVALVAAVAVGGWRWPLACATGAPAFPWRSSGAAGAATRADVDTVNAGYRRTTVAGARAADPPSDAGEPRLRRVPRELHERRSGARAAGGRRPASGRQPPVRRRDRARLADRPRSASTPLSADERAHPLALPPLVELLAGKHVSGADRLEDVDVARPRRELGPARRAAGRAPDGRRGLSARARRRPARSSSG